MKTIRIAALGVLAVGILFMHGRSVQPAAGQQPPGGRAASDVPATPPIPFGYTANNPFGGQYSGQNGSIHLAQQYAKATKEEEKKDIRKKLADSLNKEFDQLAQRQQAELAELEQQVETLKAVLKKRKDSKNAIVDRRLEQLIQDAEGLGWGPTNRQIPDTTQNNPQMK